MKTMLNGFAVCVIALLFAFGFGTQEAQADSYTFDSVGDTETINFSYQVDATTTLTGTATYTVTAISDTSVTFNVTVSNTSSTGTNEGIVATGFDVTNPTVSSTSVTNNSNPIVFTSALTTNPGDVPGVIAPGFGTVELCITNGGNCPSANPPRLQEGQTDTFSLTLNLSGSDGSNTFTMTTSFIRFAGDLGSFTFGCCGQTLPLPSSLSLLGAGMLAWGLARRRQHA